MLDFDDLSKIGFGAYRVSAGSAEHQQALIYALRSGCNIIDTSANYMNGLSEALIGDITANNPDFDTFIITKAGYIQGNNIAVLEELNQQGAAVDELITFSDDCKYSIHPDFLRSQISLSCSRLRRNQIDAFLLHNPEHYFKQTSYIANPSDYYDRIRKAFEFLEDMVSDGVIRYYGISSNTFPFSTNLPDTTDLNQVLAAAKSISRTHHFKIIQFPFNLFERDASQPHHGGVSLVKLARENGLITFCNRPLNANTKNGPVRIATYDGMIPELDQIEEQNTFAKCVDLIHRQLRRVGSTDDPMAFAVIQFLRDSRMEINCPELVTQIFQDRFYPFLNRLYEGAPSSEEIVTYKQLHHYAILHSKRAVRQRALELRQQMSDEGLIDKADTRSMAVIACEQYLASEIDHVLVGMKNAEYVDDLKSLF
jgi:aryl-alcohol dehydrogenase-like predicted oxidoreductase